MKKIICKDAVLAAQAAADVFESQINEKPESVLGLATGSTPIGLYNELASRCSAGKIDFSKARTFNLDEYYPIKAEHRQSYSAFMDKHLFSKVNFASTHLLSGEALDPYEECARYDAEIEFAGGIDLQLLGIGRNGHIGFNEPAVSYSMGSYLVDLTEGTLKANSRFFDDDETQPTQALTMGIGPIFKARKILLLITGEDKADITKKLFGGVLHTDVPACFLLLHPNVTVILDEAAAARMK
ncbi:MAG: glucosamine-6-phosphate deaminase [Oscillospiraceae bacterium]|nr:glucosamine-6-phosphate deaminase [Oscillospiraceae bacterium]MCL2278176.1 glucosamine-6-phosphate deaminase [Oscillospiraceae bacterium]